MNHKFSSKPNNKKTFQQTYNNNNNKEYSRLRISTSNNLQFVQFDSYTEGNILNGTEISTNKTLHVSE